MRMMVTCSDVDSKKRSRSGHARMSASHQTDLQRIPYVSDFLDAATSIKKIITWGTAKVTS